MSLLRYFGRRRVCAASVLMMTVFLGSCELAKNQLTFDRAAEAERQAYRDALSPAPIPEESFEDVPDFQPVLSTPEELRLPSPLVTVSVNQTVSLRDLMFELSDQAGVDLELDPQIRGSIIFTAKERPFNEVVERICEMSGLRYTFKGNVLRVELDRPYVKNYSVDFLNIVRTAESAMTTSVTVGGEDSGGSEEGGSTAPTAEGGSTSTINSTYEGDIWRELQENVEQILSSSDTNISLSTLADPVATVYNPAPPPLPVDPNNPEATLPPGPGQAGQMPASVAPTINVATVAGEPLVPNPPATFSISRQTGMISVFASERQQKLVEKYLNEFRRKASTQVLIEAKILQVDLTDEYATGIDWGSFNLTGLSQLTPRFTSPGLTPAQAAPGFTAIFKPGSDLNVAIQAISRFGTVRALSSPRVTALNNQPAIVNVAQNIVYFRISNDSSTTTTSGTSSTTGGPEATPTSVPEGVLLNVIPVANSDTGEIYLSIRPTITKKVADVVDPSIRLINAALNLQNNIPVIATQEMDSIVRLQSGQMMVMGGLMKDQNTVQDEGIPVVADLPLIGNLFKNHGDKIVKSELVIFLKATIVSGGNADETDRKIYNRFGLDRHPARL